MSSGRGSERFGLSSGSPSQEGKQEHAALASEAVERWRVRALAAERTLLPEWMLEHRLSAWSLQALIVSKTIIVKRRRGAKHDSTGLFHSDESEGRTVVYRGYFVRLLSATKSLRDQLLLELPTLMAFRTGEVCTARAEHIDFESGDMQVIDSKKYRIFLVPLHPTVAKHFLEYLAQTGIKSGLLFRRPKAGKQSKKETLSLTAVQSVWNKWCDFCGIPRMSPRMGRAYFAVDWHMVQRKSIYSLMAILRHDDVLATQKYLAKIVDYEDVKAEFYQGLRSPFSQACTRYESCPLAAPGCFCRMFTSRIEVKTQK